MCHDSTTIHGHRHDTEYSVYSFGKKPVGPDRENHPDHGLFRHLGKIGANHGLFRPSGFDLHSPFWSMAIEVTRFQHNPQPPFTRSTLIHAADPEPPPRVDVPSPAASSRSVVASSVSYHLPQTRPQRPHIKTFYLLHSLPRSHLFLCRSRGVRQTLTARSLSGFTKLRNARRTSTFFVFLGQTTIICLVTTCPDKRPIVLMPPPNP